MIDNILPILPPCNLFNFMTTLKICQIHVTHELVLKAVINDFKQITTEQANYVTTINSLNTILYLYAIIQNIHVPYPVRLLDLVNGRTHEFCLICPLDSPDNFFNVFACQTILGYEKEVNLIQVCDQKRRPFISQRKTWSPIFGYTNTTFL